MSVISSCWILCCWCGLSTAGSWLCGRSMATAPDIFEQVRVQRENRQWPVFLWQLVPAPLRNLRHNCQQVFAWQVMTTPVDAIAPRGCDCVSWCHVNPVAQVFCSAMHCKCATADVSYILWRNLNFRWQALQTMLNELWGSVVQKERHVGIVWPDNVQSSHVLLFISNKINNNMHRTSTLRILSLCECDTNVQSLLHCLVVHCNAVLYIKKSLFCCKHTIFQHIFRTIKAVWEIFNTNFSKINQIQAPVLSLILLQLQVRTCAVLDKHLVHSLSSFMSWSSQQQLYTAWSQIGTEIEAANNS